MRLKRNQLADVAITIVECCAQEASFNKYYPILAVKLIDLEKKYAFCFKNAIWDHIELLQNYPLRKINNLAKFLAFMVLFY